MIKLTMIFNTTSLSGGAVVRTGGFSESWFRLGDTIGSPEIAAARILAQKRAAALPGNDSISYLRFSKVDSPGSGSYVVKAGYPGTFSGADVPQMAVGIKIFAVGSSNKKTMELRGIPDGQIFNGETTFTTPMKGALNTYLTELFSNWGFVGRNLSTPAKGILSIAANGTFVLNQSFAYNDGDLVQVLKTTAAGRRLKGQILYATKVNDKNGVLNGWKHGDCVGGKIRLSSKVFCPISFDATAVDNAVALVRKVGRPFASYRGRAPVKQPD